jgi:hypothetical protein
VVVVDVVDVDVVDVLVVEVDVMAATDVAGGSDEVAVGPGLVGVTPRPRRHDASTDTDRTPRT